MRDSEVNAEDDHIPQYRLLLPPNPSFSVSWYVRVIVSQSINFYNSYSLYQREAIRFVLLKTFIQELCNTALSKVLALSY